MDNERLSLEMHFGEILNLRADCPLGAILAIWGAKMKRVWKPLDIGGLRLYKVKRTYIWKPDGKNHTEVSIVAATSPGSAAGIIQRLFAESDKNNEYTQAVTYRGFALDVFIPQSWWENGIPNI